MNGRTARVVFIFLFVVLLSPISAHSARSKNVLILNSYHQGYKWTDEVTSSVVTNLQVSEIPITHYIEYMGTKWAFDTLYLDQLSETYRLKFKNISFDLIVAIDDDAFTFLLKYRNTVFGRVPVVFCGVNWLDRKRLEGHSGYTGVNEDADIGANVELMLRLCPGVKNLYTIVDQTTTGQAIHRKIEDVIPRFRDRLNIRILDDLDLSQLPDTMEKVSRDSVVLLTIFQKDHNGKFIEFSEIARQLSRESHVPVFGLWDFHLGYGIVGGLLTSGWAQGQSAGKLGLRVLAGESPDSLPVLMQSPNRYLFDYRQLVRFGLDRNALPVSSVLINQPASSYTFSKELVRSVSVGGILLTIAVILLILNIHRRNRAELALRESDAKYHSLVDNISIGVYRTSAQLDGKILQANPAMARIFGYESVREMYQTKASDLYQDPQARKLFLNDLARDGFVNDRELSMVRKDGTAIWVLSNATAVFDEKGALQWVDGANENITEKKLLEEQLRQAQKMEAVGTLAGGIAHDFNNILTAIIGYGNLLQQGSGENPQIMKYLEPILLSAEKAAQLTQSLLAFSRRQVIELKPVDINRVVDDMGKLLLRVIGEEIELHIEEYSGSLLALADRGQVEQVLMNLVTNARDALPGGGVISVETERIVLTRELLVRHEFMRPGSYAVLSVSDSGKGMDEETRARIFEPFFSTKEVGKGTGLGLAIVYGIVKQHNGDISVYSEVGRGTTFKIYLPLVAEGEVGEMDEQQPVPRVHGGSETILIGEDSNQVRRLAEDILTMAGYAVITAIDGEDVLRNFRNNSDRIDLLLLDVVMPKKNGKQVFEEIRLVRPDIKVLFMSGYSANIIHKKGVLNEGLNFIAKPLSPDRLLVKVHEILSGVKPTGSYS